jgi:2-methylcitrate dehydratase PrpD
VLANVVAANALDIDDGYRPCKGHPGAFIIAPVIAACEDRGVCDLLPAVAAGYELATRAGVATHRYYDRFHASGSWGPLGTAACVGRVLGLTERQLDNALGLAEYHAALSSIERCLGTPAMTKDGIGWGAYAGACAAYLAARGFTGNPSLFSDPSNADLMRDLGERWRVLDLYFKPYSCCRWAQQGVDALAALRRERRLTLADVDRILLHTFREATLLQQTAPRNTEEAQYHLFWPMAAMLAYGDVGPAHVSDEAVRDPLLLELIARMEAVSEPDIQDRFPAEALGWVEIRLRNGETIRSELTAARGDAHIPLSDDEILGKFRQLAEATLEERTDDVIDAVMNIEAPESAKRLLQLVGGLARKPCARGLRAPKTAALDGQGAT